MRQPRGGTRYGHRLAMSKSSRIECRSSDLLLRGRLILAVELNYPSLWNFREHKHANTRADVTRSHFDYGLDRSVLQPSVIVRDAPIE